LHSNISSESNLFIAIFDLGAGAYSSRLPHRHDNMLRSMAVVAGLDANCRYGLFHAGAAPITWHKGSEFPQHLR
jgi:hypothetical protein